MARANVIWIEMKDLEALAATPCRSPIELCHNEEPLGRVNAGAIEVYDEAPCGETRFWLGLKALKARLSVCALPQA